MAIELAHEDGQPIAPVGDGGAVTLKSVEPPDAVTAALAVVTTSNERLTALAALGLELAQRYRGVVADVGTVKGYNQIACIRREFRETVRYPMQALQDSGSKMLGTMQRQFNVRAKELIAEAEKHETPFDEQLTAEDARKERIKKERDEAEARRRQQHIDALSAIGMAVAQAAGESAPELQARIDAIYLVEVDDRWEEYRGQAMQAKEEAMRQLTGMLLVARAEELERQEIEATRQQQEAVRAQQAETAAALQRQQEALAAQQAELERKQHELTQARREREDAIQRRIDAFSASLVPPHVNSAAIEAEIQARSASITEERFGDRVVDALTAQREAIVALRVQFDAVIVAEREAAERMRRDSITVNINNLAAYNEIGLASASFLRERIEALSAEPMDEAAYGDRLETAATLQAAILHKLTRTLAEAEQREQDEHVERLASEAAQARLGRLQDLAIGLYEAMFALYDHGDPDMFRVIFKPFADYVELGEK